MVEKKEKTIFFKNARPHNWLDDAREQKKKKQAKVAGKAKNANSDA